MMVLILVNGGDLQMKIIDWSKDDRYIVISHLILEEWFEFIILLILLYSTRRTRGNSLNPLKALTCQERKGSNSEKSSPETGLARD
jgi:hypothetical protein